MGEKVTIYPKTKPLSAAELISMRNIEIGTLKVGLKKTKPDGTPQEAEDLAKIYAELEKQLSVPRIERLCGRSSGEWDPDRGAVKILRKEGKFEVFGYSLNGDLYLEYYEALFLLEMNRLEISYYSIPMSIEQAYVLFLGEDESIKFSIYLVYSMLSRVGYIVQKFQNFAFSPKAPTVEDCIWDILLNSIQNKPIPDHIRNSEHFIEVERSMNVVREKIMNQKTESQNEVQDGGVIDGVSFQRRLRPPKKRKQDSTGPTNYKRAREEPSSSSSHQSFIDFLKKEEEYKKFEGLFQTFDVINLKPQFEYDDDANVSDLEIHFDVFLHKDTFKKSEPKPPAFRLAILKKNQEFPNRSQVSKCYYSQEYRIPVLVAMISDSKHIQAFLYHFT